MEAHYIQAKEGNKAAKELTTNLARLGPDYTQAKGRARPEEGQRKVFALMNQITYKLRERTSSHLFRGQESRE
jgi:CRISPR/Cas system CSM-associated protein Csm2 small subunit